MESIRQQEQFFRRIGVAGGSVYFIIYSITQLFFALFAEELGATSATIGIMLTLKAVLPLCISIPTGGLIDCIGARVVLRWGCAATVFSLFLMVWSPNLVILSLSQLLIGASMLLMASSLEVAVSEGAAKEERDHYITLYSTWCSVGNMAGPLIGGAVVFIVGSFFTPDVQTSAGVYRATFLVTLCIAMVYSMVVFAFSSRNAEKHGSLRDAQRLFRPKDILTSFLTSVQLIRYTGVQFALIGTFLVHFLQSIWTGFLPLYLNGIGYSAMLISLIVSSRGVAAMVSRAFLGLLLKRNTKERILISAGCTAALCLIGVPIFHSFFILILALCLVLGCASGVNMPVSTMIMVDDTSEQERGTVSGLRMFANLSSQLTAPALFGAVGGTFGLGSAFVSGGSLMILILLGFATYYRFKRRTSLPY